MNLLTATDYQDNGDIDARKVHVGSIKAELLSKLAENKRRQLSLKVHKRVKTDLLISVLDEIAYIENVMPSVSLLRSQ